jgi:hypothetical protein
MRALIVAAAASLALSGCTTVNQTIRDSLPEICTAATAAHVAFGVYASDGDVSPETVLAERLAWRALEPLCIEPEGQNSGTVIVAAAQAYATIVAALNEAETE